MKCILSLNAKEIKKNAKDDARSVGGCCKRENVITCNSHATCKNNKYIAFLLN
jgi:hypothetical protein